MPVLEVVYLLKCCKLIQDWDPIEMFINKKEIMLNSIVYVWFLL